MIGIAVAGEEIIDLAWEVFNNPDFVKYCSLEGLFIMVVIAYLLIVRKGIPKLLKPRKKDKDNDK